MQSVSSRIWTRVAAFISYDDNNYTNYTTLSNIRYQSRVKWNNPGKGVAPSPTAQCSSYWKGSPLDALDYGRQLYFYFITTYSSSVAYDSFTIEFLSFYFDIVAGVWQGDTLTPYFFIIRLDYVFRTSFDWMKKNGFKLIKKEAEGTPHKQLRTQTTPMT